jgi:uncharacterized protein (TIGR03437 family)
MVKRRRQPQRLVGGQRRRRHPGRIYRIVGLPGGAGSFSGDELCQLSPEDNTEIYGSTFVPGPPSTGYVTKLNAAGSGLVFSTFIGGSGEDAIHSLAVDGEGNFYLAGLATSPDFPGLSGVPDGCRPNYVYPTPFFRRLSADGSALTATQLAYGLTAQREFDHAVFDGHGKAVLALGSSLASMDLFAPTPNLVCVIDAAGLAPLAQVAPGQLVTLLGNGMSSDEGTGFQPQNGHVPSLGDGVSVMFNGVPAPILYSSASQVNVQVPYEIAGQSSVRLEMQGLHDAIPGARDFAAAASAPSAFVTGAEYAKCGTVVTNSLLAVALNADGSRNSCENPADAGSVVSLFVNGLGTAGANPATGVISAEPAVPLNAAITDRRAREGSTKPPDRGDHAVPECASRNKRPSVRSSSAAVRCVEYRCPSAPRRRRKSLKQCCEHRHREGSASRRSTGGGRASRLRRRFVLRPRAFLATLPRRWRRQPPCLCL